MAKVWFTYEDPLGVPSELDVLGAMRIRVAEIAAKRLGYELDLDGDDAHEHQFSVTVPDNQVTAFVGGLFGYGIAPGCIDFEGISKEEASRLTTIELTHEVM